MIKQSTLKTLALLTGIVVLTCFNTYSQTTLEFNQVVLLTTNSSSQTWTVPNGKVWKVISGSCSGNYSDPLSLKINGTDYYLTPQYYGTIQGRFQLLLPLWLPAATVVGLPFPYNINRFISVIEFNVNP